MATAKRFSRVMDHRAQVARARRYLRRNVGREVELKAVAKAAGASMFHLARLHRAITGETVGGARTRMRIEAAAAALVKAPKRAVGAIALEVGFETPSSLNKAFRAALGVSPSEFRAATAAERARRLARLGEARTKPRYRLRGPVIRRSEGWRVVYVRELGPYADVSGPLAWAELELRLAAQPLAGTRIAASYDDPRSEPAESLRYDAGVVVDAETAAPAGTKRATWAGGAFAVFAFGGDFRFIADAFRAIFAGWDRARWVVRDAPCLELYPDDPSLLPVERLRAELWVPIEDPEES